MAIDIDNVFEKKLSAFDAQTSQFYEWLPWVDGRLAEVPQDLAARLKWLPTYYKEPVTTDVRRALEKWYGPGRAAAIQHAEAFELCEYGAQPDDKGLRRLFPMMK